MTINWTRMRRVFWTCWLVMLAGVLTIAHVTRTAPDGWEWFAYGFGFCTALYTLFGKGGE